MPDIPNFITGCIVRNCLFPNGTCRVEDLADEIGVVEKSETKDGIINEEVTLNLTEEEFINIKNCQKISFVDQN